MGPALADAVGLLLGMAADRLLGDPMRGHPVAAFGRAAAVLERRLYRDSAVAGTAYWSVAVAAPVLGAALAARLVGRRALVRAALTSTLVWATVGGRQLADIAVRVAGRLETGDLDGARELMPSLVGRDPQTLDGPALTRATVESVAENTADAVVGPLLWGALAGPTGVVAYRAINTLDAMVGHRSPRYRRFGLFAARSDDLANLVPARLTAMLVAALAGLVGGRPADAVRTWRRDGRRHPSPNAGPVEAAFAGALGRTLGGPVSYGGRTQMRGPLGVGPPPIGEDIVRVVRLSRSVGVAAAVACAGLAAARGSLPGRG